MLELPELVSWAARLMKWQIDAVANQQASPTAAKTMAPWKDVKIAAVRALAAIEWVLQTDHDCASSQAHKGQWLGVLGLLLDVVTDLLADRVPDAQLDMQDVFLHGLEPICSAWLTMPIKKSILIPFLQRLATDKRLLGSTGAPPPSPYAWKQQSSAVLQLRHVVGKDTPL